MRILRRPQFSFPRGCLEKREPNLRLALTHLCVFFYSRTLRSFQSVAWDVHETLHVTLIKERTPEETDDGRTLTRITMTIAATREYSRSGTTQDPRRANSTKIRDDTHGSLRTVPPAEALSLRFPLRLPPGPVSPLASTGGAPLPSGKCSAGARLPGAVSRRLGGFCLRCRASWELPAPGAGVGGWRAARPGQGQMALLALRVPASHPWASG